ncbi:MAG: type II toxin-antitoxin system HipA family toxin [Bacteroidales bacterium]|nr:type II toxin-antitoxin system HipA family toxin [Bacteroidales bacterium]
MVDVAEIKIWGEFAGAVRWDKNNQLASFQYDDKFLGKGYDLSPIKMPVRDGSRIYSFPELRKSKDEQTSAFNGLPGLLADSLPDKYGNQLINVWLAQNGRPPDSMNPVEKLCFIGARGMGALEFEPGRFKAGKRTFPVEIKSLVEIAQRMLSEREGFEVNLPEDEQKAVSEILKIGTSAGGGRPKALIAFNKNSGEVRSGQTVAPKGFDHWLIKLDGVSDVQFGSSHGFGRVEYAYYRMAKDCQIQMMDSELLEEHGRAHFMTRRFDREGTGTKHHVHTWSGIQHFDYNNLYAYSYEQLFQTMRQLKMTYPEAEQMFRRMVFNVLASNNDDHAKNFSFLLKQNGHWELAPAYDLCYSYDPENVWVSQHTLSINGKHRGINRNDLMTVATINNIKGGGNIISEIQELVCSWEKYAKEAEVLSKLRTDITKTLAAFQF